jgi:CRISPR-associated endonuclease Csy4
MDHYIEIKLLPDPEFPASTLMNALFNKLHKTLFDLHSNDIGVSFPSYGQTLGLLLRVHGSEESLIRLERQDWIGRMKDYCQQSPVQTVPENVQYRTVYRHQDKRSNVKIRRLLQRQAQGKRGTQRALSNDDISEYLKGMVTANQTGPYLELTSSKGQRYRRYIFLGVVQENSVPGEFDQFGLSKSATIPWF